MVLYLFAVFEQSILFIVSYLPIVVFEVSLALFVDINNLALRVRYFLRQFLDELLFVPLGLAKAKLNIIAYFICECWLEETYWFG